MPRTNVRKQTTMQKKNSTAKQPTGESTYAKRQCRRAERIILASGIYDDAFRHSVQKALEQNKQGQPSNLPNLIKEAASPAFSTC
jgi:acyl-CoA reductase-like NAD-dependent aldehyde dehydrogenase